ncbi:hypothetical protein [Streptomyces kebangsaanensis]|uniref:hypothetical protein n=1 Tax=Streptomyces kebangsaanensis TaxID=864058 RepID=UPI00389A88A2
MYAKSAPAEAVDPRTLKPRIKSYRTDVPKAARFERDAGTRHDTAPVDAGTRPAHPAAVGCPSATTRRGLLARPNRAGQGTRVEFHPLDQSRVTRPRQRGVEYRSPGGRHRDRIVDARGPGGRRDRSEAAGFRLRAVELSTAYVRRDSVSR